MTLQREKGENDVPVNSGWCLSVDTSEAKLASQGLTLHWEWISTRAFDCGQMRLHSPRLSCQILD